MDESYRSNKSTKLLANQIMENIKEIMVNSRPTSSKHLFIKFREYT